MGSLEVLRHEIDKPILMLSAGIGRLVAEGVGFEPTRACALPVFKTGALDRSATLPGHPPLEKSLACPHFSARRVETSARSASLRCNARTTGGFDATGTDSDERAGRRQRSPGQEDQQRSPEGPAQHLPAARAHHGANR